MRRQIILTFAVAFIGAATGMASAQAPSSLAPAGGSAFVINRGGGVAGTGIGVGAGAAGQHAPLIVGSGHLGAGTGGTGLGVGNATGGITGTTSSGTGGLLDTASWGSSTGGVKGSGRGLGPARAVSRTRLNLAWIPAVSRAAPLVQASVA